MASVILRHKIGILTVSEGQCPYYAPPTSATAVPSVDRRVSIVSARGRQVFDDVATELAMAILQYFQTSPPEERLYRCMRALAKFAQVGVLLPLRPGRGRERGEGWKLTPCRIMGGA